MDEFGGGRGGKKKEKHKRKLFAIKKYPISLIKEGFSAQHL